MKLLVGSSNQPLAEKLALSIGVDKVKAQLGQFSNSETKVYIKDEVRDEHVVILQSLSKPTNDHLMEFILLVDAAKRKGAEKITGIIPWLGYSLQDKIFRPGEPLAAKVVADIISTTKIDQLILFDLHNPTTLGFFSQPVLELNAVSLFASHAKKSEISQTVVASPDFGGLKRAREFATTLNLPLVNIDKSRSSTTGRVEKMELHGSVKNKNVLVFDDAILSGGTVIEAAKILKQNGANQVKFMATHGLFTNNALAKLDKSAVDKLVVTNSVEQIGESKKIEVLDCSEVLKKALRQ